MHDFRSIRDALVDSELHPAPFRWRPGAHVSASGVSPLELHFCLRKPQRLCGFACNAGDMQTFNFPILVEAWGGRRRIMHWRTSSLDTEGTLFGPWDQILISYGYELRVRATTQYVFPLSLDILFKPVE